MEPLQILVDATVRHRLLDQTPESLRVWVTKAGEPAYRADQVLEWVYRKGARSYDDMSNLSKALRKRLGECFHLYEAEVAHTALAADGVVKLLLRWADGETTECVSIPALDSPRRFASEPEARGQSPQRRVKGRRTACISTQVGCPVGCVFCASGIGGVRRNLSAGQIVEQAMIAAHQAGDPARLSNIVFMGMGEPLANYDATVQAVRTINADWGMNIGARKITVSTVGLPKQMKRLADEELQITLALSLHAPNDALRRELIPWAEGVRIDQLVDACRYYFDKTGREVTLEYVLLHEVNDRPEHAAELADLAREMRCNVNLIQYNSVEGLPYERPTDKAAHAFLHALRDRGINTHLRASRGRDIEGACGQLRRRIG